MIAWRDAEQTSAGCRMVVNSRDRNRLSQTSVTLTSTPVTSRDRPP